MIFKIQTERGELVIQSEADDVTVVVKRGDSMVESLQIQRGDNNRISLRQGTYTVEIDGADQGVRLTEDRVKIERNQPATIAVQTVNEFDGEISSAVSSSQFKADAVRTYQGHPYSYWLDILIREQDAETLSAAMRAVETLSRETPQRHEAALRLRHGTYCATQDRFRNV